MLLEPYPQDRFPKDFVQWARPKRPLQGWEMYRACVKQWIRQPMILLFDKNDVVDKRGNRLKNDSTQAIPHIHSWGGFLHFYCESSDSPLHGSGIPPVFCSKEDVSIALRAGVGSITHSIAEIRDRVSVSVTDVGWPGYWTATPSVHMQKSIEDLQSPLDTIVHQAMARIRETVYALIALLPPYEHNPLLTTFLREAQSSIVDRSLPIDVLDAKTIAFPPLLGHFRQFLQRSYRPDTENPFGGKILVPNGPIKWRPRIRVIST